MDLEQDKASTEEQSTNQPVSTNPALSTPVTPTVSPSSEQKKSGMKALILVILLLIIAGAGAAYMLMKDDKKPVATKTAVIVKKEVPLLRVMSTDGGFDENLFPPAYASVNAQTIARRQMFDSLVSFSNGKDIVPQLAISWTNPDTSTWQFKLRKDVTFHNGNKLTATEVKGSIDAAIAISDYETFVSTIKSVDVVDENTIKITTNAPDGALLNKLAFISIYDTSAKTIDSMAGSGPYVVKTGTTPETSKLTLTAVDNYFGGTVYTKEVVFLQEPDTSKIADAMLKGEIDISSSTTTAEIAKIKAALPSATVIDSEALGAFGLFMNTIKTGPLQKKEVRQAVHRAMDKQKIIEAGGSPGTVPTQFIAASVPGYNPKIKASVQDIAGAKKLLSDAGYPTGFTMDVTLGKSSLTMGTEVKRQLAEVGVTMNIKEASSGTFFGDASAGKFEAWMAAYTTDINDASDVIAAVYQGNSYKNYYKNTKLDEKMKSTNETFDAKTRLSYLQDAVQLITDDIPFAPIRNRKYQYVVTKPLVINEDYPMAATFGVNYWKVYQK